MLLCLCSLARSLQYDFNNQGSISYEAVCLYLSAVFRVLYARHPDMQTRMNGANPQALAEITATHLFETAELDEHGCISLEAFQQWYVAGGAAGGVGDTVVDAAQRPPPSWVNLGTVRELTNLRRHHVNDVVDTFRRFADSEGGLSREAFFQACYTFVTSNSAASDARLHMIFDRLFAMFDTNNDGMVDNVELASGLTVLCGGTRDDKVEAAFRLVSRGLARRCTQSSVWVCVC